MGLKERAWRFVCKIDVDVICALLFSVAPFVGLSFVVFRSKSRFRPCISMSFLLDVSSVDKRSLLHR